MKGRKWEGLMSDIWGSVSEFRVKIFLDKRVKIKVKRLINYRRKTR
jgi:hypothetical protein